MVDCWECANINTQRCEGCEQGYMDGIDGWVQFDEPTHFMPKESEDKMETVEVVIKIPCSELEYAKKGYTKAKADVVYRAIENGTVLPKGHDALLDAGQLMDYCHNQIEGHKYVDCNVIARFPCVIKADRGEDDGRENG